MNEYKFCDLKIGMTEAFEYVVTEEKMKEFLLLSGDENPLHIDGQFAREHGFKDRVVYGMLTASLFSKLGGVKLPGKYCIIQQIESKFLKPVYVGDRLTVSGMVYELNQAVQRAEIKIEVWNQDGRKVVKGSLYVGFLE